MAITYNGSTCGVFTNELNKVFTYRKVSDVPYMICDWQKKFNFEFVIDVQDFHAPYRYAIIKKTVAYVVVDEDEYGSPVFEKWKIKQHRKFV